MSFIYLASPYTTDDAAQLEWRVEQAGKAAAELMVEGHKVFSPIVHSHHVASYMSAKLQMNHDFWMKQDLAILRHCKKVVVLMLPGWRESKGVKREIAAAKKVGIVVEVMPWPR